MRFSPCMACRKCGPYEVRTTRVAGLTAAAANAFHVRRAHAASDKERQTFFQVARLRELYSGEYLFFQGAKVASCGPANRARRCSDRVPRRAPCAGQHMLLDSARQGEPSAQQDWTCGHRWTEGRAHKRLGCRRTQSGAWGRWGEQGGREVRTKRPSGGTPRAHVHHARSATTSKMEWASCVCALSTA